MSALLQTEPGIKHRPMMASDLDAMLAIEVLAYPYPWTRGNFVDSLAAGYWAELRVDAEGRLLGYALALPGFEEMHLLNLTVAPASQRRGHGHALLRRLQACAVARGDACLWLEVRPSNTPARALYRQLGFTEVGLRRNYYPAPHQKREDALVLRLDLRVGQAQASAPFPMTLPAAQRKDGA
jgi:[ribosomal protein S18]-alanine N-acetyltransferase